MEELYEDLLAILGNFEEEYIGYYELGEWLSTNGCEIAEILSIK